jgi:MerR family transcriptional regulator, thiopeptide resistance regulator
MVRLVAQTWRIGELARETGLTIRTLHHYDAIGLVTPSSRTSGGHRVYSEPDVERLYAVVVLRRIGLSAAAIGEQLADPSWEIRSVVRVQCAELDAELAALGALRHRLDAMLLLAVEEPAGLIRAMRDLPSTPFAVRRAFALLPYDDVEDAQRRLVDMFGFEPGPVERHPDGSVAHAVVLAGTGFVHLHPPAGGVVPPGPDGRASAIIVAAVADVDVHCAHAAEHGALISYGPADMSYGVREYGARDHAGHHWSFQSSHTTKETT